LPKLSLNYVLERMLGKLTTDPAERNNILWLTMATLCGGAAQTLSTATMLMAYLEKSGFSMTKIGLISGTIPFAYMVSNFLLMGVVDRTQKRISVYGCSGYGLATTTVLLGLTVAMPHTLISPLFLLIALIAVLSLNQPVLAFNGMMSYNVLVRTIRVKVRGRVTAIYGVAAGLFGILLSLVSGVLLKRLGYPHGYTLSFLIAAGFWGLQAIFIMRLSELPDIAFPSASRSAFPITAIIDICRLKVFRTLAYPHILRGLLMGMMTLVVPSQIQRLDLPHEYAGYMMATTCAAGLLAAVVIGFTLDRWGAGVVTLLGDILTAAAWLTLIVTPSPIVFLALFLIFNIGDLLEQRAIPLGSFEIVPAGIMGGFSAARIMILFGTISLGTVLGGKLLDQYNVNLIFSVAAILKLVMGIWFLKIFGFRHKQATPEQARVSEPVAGYSPSDITEV
jgi:MFS family permease